MTKKNHLYLLELEENGKPTETIRRSAWPRPNDLVAMAQLMELKPGQTVYVRQLEDCTDWDQNREPKVLEIYKRRG